MLQPKHNDGVSITPEGATRLPPKKPKSPQRGTGKQEVAHPQLDHTGNPDHMTVKVVFGYLNSHAGLGERLGERKVRLLTVRHQ